ARVGIKQARINKFDIDWDGYIPPCPKFLGTKTFEDYNLETVRSYIDWTPFFATWELKGRYPAILENERYGKAARDLFRDAEKMLDLIIKEKWVRAQVTFGFWPAASHVDDIVLYTHEDRKTPLATLHTLRQQIAKSEGKPNYALSDFIAPFEHPKPDYLGGFCVTAGLGEDKQAEKFARANDDYSAILFKALCDRLAEGLAEHMHERVRREFWGYETKNRLTTDGLIAEGYAGIRPAPGYPAQPDHTEKKTLFKLLGGAEKTGVHLTESYAMQPASSVSGLYFSHPKSLYFGVGKIEKDQVEDYAKRKGMSVEEAEKWLAPILNYAP
ncbi:MAG TPA: methionine synthase, partial [Hellea balneolensis]|nr:methionine synthase [Hellea balneolensis]